MLQLENVCISYTALSSNTKWYRHWLPVSFGVGLLEDVCATRELAAITSISQVRIHAHLNIAVNIAKCLSLLATDLWHA